MLLPSNLISLRNFYHFQGKIWIPFNTMPTEFIKLTQIKMTNTRENSVWHVKLPWLLCRKNENIFLRREIKKVLWRITNDSLTSLTFMIKIQFCTSPIITFPYSFTEKC